MNLKKITESLAERRRHTQGMRAARRVVYLATSPSQARPSDVVALAFGWFRLRMSETEALDFLNAVLVDRGEGSYSEAADQ
jgi:hypothetical protein